MIFSLFLQDGDHVEVAEEHAGEGAEAGNASEEMSVHRRQASRPSTPEKRFTNQVKCFLVPYFCPNTVLT